MYLKSSTFGDWSSGNGITLSSAVSIGCSLLYIRGHGQRVLSGVSTSKSGGVTTHKKSSVSSGTYTR